MTNRNRPLGTLHSLSDLIAALSPQVASISDAEAVLEDLLDFFEGEAGNFGVEEIDHYPADTADSCVEAEGTAWGDSLGSLLGPGLGQGGSGEFSLPSSWRGKWRRR